MQKTFTSFIKLSLLVLLISIFSNSNLYSQDSKDFVVFLTADVTKTPTPSIKLNWRTNSYARTFYVFRKEKESTSWGYTIATLDSNATSYTDNNVEVGKAYEYQVLARSLMPVTGGNLDYSAIGYIYAGIEVKPKDSYGTVLLLVEESLKYYFSDKIKRLVEDLIAEGWNVVQKDAPRGDSSYPGTPNEVRNIIKQEYTKDNTINTVFILGRVPVPYSGYTNPDGHENHIAAWPADLYYGTIDDKSDNFWTDIYANTDTAKTKPGRKENENIPGDGKFDQSEIRVGDVTLRIGRVDFYNMPAFAKTEQQLLEQYLDKDHDYRTGNIPVVMRGLVDVNFSPSGNLEMSFGSSGWRNFAPFFGSDSIFDKNPPRSIDWFSTLKTEPYYWAYGCGGGIYTGAGGIGNTSNFADTNQKNAVFTMLFGSYFGDWDSQNNFLRAGLCSNPSILTCAWAGRPHWYLHHMALGEPIGYSTMLTQNNFLLYIPLLVYTPNYPNGVVITSGLLGVHTALMGDPTLRMYMGTVPSAKNLSVIQPAGEHVEISWEKPDEQGEYLYNVYLSTSENGPFAKINEGLLADTSFTDPELHEGMVYYMVRSFKVQNTMSGSFYNSGRGIMKNIQATAVDEQMKIEHSLAVSPNPATTNINIELSLEKDAIVSLDIYDINGNRVVNICTRNLAGGTHSFAWNMLNNSNQKVCPGVYLVKLTGIGLSNAEKFIVMP
ncbi:MAG: hypothetical protein A2X61_14305 [Ignavibacteria bacterium GWB2_35_12]|nr:MAG: hypothetical protein A2X61_14305 [Ignavibacteria bacterium GWB2_35_12]OGU96480.1 MAG: hypothetical protein A2220_05930 [Ignavibacteria bacterium RIFOXYA2_FULL_35_10]OGV22895.1 MAG: hypothetical protein A2475_10470 [Ignavibacteria bacterium RIFOXYC2_FULL_35_21]